LLAKELDGRTITWIDVLLTPKIHLMLDGHLGHACWVLRASPPTEVQWLYTIFWIKYSSQVV
jgi:hypothetical protein